MLTSEENNDYWKMISDFSDEHEDIAIPLKELNEEIGNYPSPIAGCDEQFDYLLERRTKLEQRKHEYR